MRKKIEVKIEVKYNVDHNSLNEKCEAIIYVTLPCNKDGYLLEKLRGEEYILDSKLDALWGSKTDEGRKHFEVFNAINWKELKKIVKQEIEKIEEKLVRIKEENEKLEKEKPEDEVIVLKI